MNIYILKCRCSIVGFGSIQTYISKKCFSNKEKAEEFVETWRAELLKQDENNPFRYIDHIYTIDVCELKLEEN